MSTESRTNEILPAARSVDKALEGIQAAMFRRPPQPEPDKTPKPDVVASRMLEGGLAPSFREFRDALLKSRKD